jgi:hypothetical protein
MNKNIIVIRIVLVLVALAHLLIGAIGIIPAIPLSIVLKFYGSSITINLQMAHIIQMFGAYMFTIGILGAIAIWNPIKQKAIVYAISFLLFLRVLQRVIFAGQQFEVFAIPPTYYWAQTAIFFVFALCLVLFTLLASKTEEIKQKRI